MSSTPTTMKYIKIEEHGGPEVLKLDTMSVPEPGPGEVLIRVTAAGVNRPDVMHRFGPKSRNVNHVEEQTLEVRRFSDVAERLPVPDKKGFTAARSLGGKKSQEGARSQIS